MKAPKFLADLAAKTRTIFGALPSGLEPLEQHTGTETVKGLVLPTKRTWPLKMLADGRKPHVTSRHSLNNPSRKGHNGVDLFYPYLLGQDPPMKDGDGGRAGNWWIPDNTLAIAPADGLVQIAGSSRTGYRVWIQHAGGIFSGGFHMKQIFVRAGEAVYLGADIGIVSDNPVDHDGRHLHWELYRGDIGKYPKGTVDPEIWLKNAFICT